MKNTLIFLLCLMLVSSAFAQDYSLSFDGIDDYIEIPDADCLSPQSFTIEFFVKQPGRTTSGRYTYLFKDNLANHCEYMVGNNFVQMETGGLYLFVGNTICQMPDGTQPPLNHWIHIAVTFDSGKDSLKIFIDGSLQFQKNVTDEVVGTAGKLYLGWFPQDPSYNAFQGFMDEMRISNSIRYSSDFSVPSSEFSSDANTVALYHFNEGEGNTLIDHSGNGNNGTINGAIWSDDVPPSDGLVAYYPFNGDADDKSGNGYNGNVSGAQLTEDRLGNINCAYSFDGVDDFIDVPFEQELRLNAPFTLSIWANIADTNTHGEILIGKSASSLGHRNYCIEVLAGSTIEFLYHQDVYTEIHLSNDTPLEIGKWYHIVAIHDSSEIKLYINNCLVKSRSVTAPNVVVSYLDTPQNLAIGRHKYGSDDAYFPGCLDDIRIFNRALSNVKIDSLYHEGGWNPSLVAYYPFNGDADDESGNGNNGTVVGATPTTDRFGNENSAYSFDGVDDYIYIPSEGDLSFDASSQSYTVSLFFSVDSFGNVLNHDLRLIFDREVGTNSWVSYGISVIARPTGDLYKHIATDMWNGGYTGYSFRSTDPIGLNQWYHVAVVVKAGLIYELYLNGQLNNSMSLVGITNTKGNTGGITIGAAHFAEGLHLHNGSIDEICIYNRALTESEIDSLYHLGGWQLYETGTVNDIDDNTYQTVKIGNQWWMAENLKVTHYRNGESIPNITDNTAWINLTSGAYCDYNNDVNKVVTYGRLYNWYSATDSRNIAPTGWHVPTDTEWKELEIFLGMSQSDADNMSWRGTDEGNKLRSTSGWNSGCNGTNESGFSALPGGDRFNNGVYDDMGDSGCWWSATEGSSDNAWYRSVYYLYSTVDRYSYNKRYGFSVRCVKDENTSQDALVAYYPFKGDADDKSGNGNNGSVNGPTPTNDRFGNVNSAFSFDGVDDYIEVPYSEELEIGENLTITGWVKVSRNDTIQSIICNRKTANGHAVYSLAIESQKLQFIDDADTRVVCYYDSLFPIDKWTFISVRRDRNNQVVYLGLNGNEQSMPIGSGTSYGDNNPIFIGKLYWDNDYLKGMIDDIRIYDCVLSKSEIDSLYHEGGWGKFICLKIDSTDAIIGDTVDINITLSNVNSLQISSAEFRIAGYSAGLDFLELDTTGTLTGSAGWSYSVNETGDSLVIIWLAGANDISINGILCKLRFKAIGAECAFYPTFIKDVVFNTGEDCVIVTNGGVYIKPIPDYGDVDENGIIQAYDASLILKHTVGLDTLYCQGLTNADVTLNGTVSAFDASVILQYGVGLIAELPYDSAEIINKATKGDFVMQDGTLSPQSNVVEIPIEITNGQNIMSFESVFTYNSNDLEFQQVEWNNGLNSYSIVINQKPGNISIAGAGVDQIVNEGLVGTLKFVVKGAGQWESTTVAMKSLKLNEKSVQNDVTSSIVYNVVKIHSEKGSVPSKYELSQNYPNPFNAMTTFTYALPKKSNVTFSIIDINGRVVKKLTNENQQPGYYSVKWDASGVSSGVYFYKLNAGEFTEIKKCILVK